MSEDYNQKVAFHYSKYRPPLHRTILFKAIGVEKCFSKGLDIGCGTGRSTKPLSELCGEVIGIDPSRTMIENAEDIPSVAYHCGDERILAQFQSKSFDIVTFAGSLFYAKNEKLRSELKRVCRDGALVIVYDFELLLGEFLPSVGLKLSEVDSTGYDHSVNISDWKEFVEEAVCRERVYLAPSADELAHFILAHSTWHEELSLQLHVQDPFAELVKHLKSKGSVFRLPVNTFHSRYKVGGIGAPREPSD